jgi:uracil-DNA glycosylase
MNNLSLTDLLAEISQCQHCASKLPHTPRPVVRVAKTASILVIGQAPGSRVHASGTPWDDPSGERLRDWMGVDSETFYDTSRIAIMPMGFCYPGKGKSGDLPPRPECAPLWHERLLQSLPGIQLTLLIGSYAQNYYLDKTHSTLTARVAAWQDYMPNYLPLVHPSPRNTHWLQKNPWFQAELIPALRDIIKKSI